MGTNDEDGGDPFPERQSNLQAVGTSFDAVQDRDLEEAAEPEDRRSRSSRHPLGILREEHVSIVFAGREPRRPRRIVVEIN